MAELAIRVENLGKRYVLGGQGARYKTLRDSLVKAVTAPVRRARAAVSRTDNHIWALRNVSLEIGHGDVVGVIGRNGAGKSTLLKILSRVTEPTEGYAETRGRVGSLLEVGTGFHNELTGRENIYLSGAILGMRRAVINEKFDEIVAFAEVQKFVDTPVKHYSSGMYLRLAFAVAAHLEPEILLVDEVLAVGDASFQKKCLGKMGDVARQGRTVLFVSHNMGAIRSLCSKGILLNNGKVSVAGDLTKTIESYYRLIGALQDAGDTADGIGSNGSRFGQVSLNGKKETTVSQSQGFQVSTELRIDREIGGFSFFCMLEDMQGRSIFTLREESPDLGFKVAPLGTYAVTVDIPPLWLNPGLYSVYFKVLFWGEYGSARHVSDKFPLDVEGVNSLTDSILHPRAAWAIQRRGL
jgi:lipopolysaccharide transport system ATP-binding protein